MSKFVSLHNHTYFSILNSLISPKELMKRASELGHQAVGITDYSSMAGIWDALKYSREFKVKLIVGSEFYFTDDLSVKGQDRLRHIIFIAKNYAGYKNLLLLNKIAFENGILIGKRIYPTVDWNVLKKYSDGVICLTGGGSGIVANLIMKKDFDRAEKALQNLKDIYGDDFGAEVQTHNLNRNANAYSDPINQIFVNQHIIRLAKKFDIRVVPTNASRYLKKEEAETHDALLAIGSMQPVYSNARIKFNVQDLYLKSYDEVMAFFSRNYGKDFANFICENTIYFAEKCENPDWVELKYSNKSGKELPTFPLEQEPDYEQFLNWLNGQSDEIKKLEHDKNYLRFKCELSLEKMIKSEDKEKYRKRLDIELDTLYYCGVASYCLIVADYVNWARKNGIQESPGRGSVGGSLVAYLIGIHKADPIKYGLVFERFHNKSKKSYSDIDCDFPKASRDRVINYITEKYGKDRVSQISNFNYITPKVYVRDICRSFDLALDRKASVQLGNDIADIIPKKDIDGREIRSYKEMSEKSPLFLAYAERYPKLKESASICEKPRALGMHASGIVVSDRPVAEITPTRIDKDGVLSVQLDKDRVEEFGLVKMDILGLETLDIIQHTNELIKASGKEVPVIDYDSYDKKTYDLISSGNTYGVFQFGTSAGTIALCKKILPKTIEDLAVITTIARPASKEIRDDYIKTRAGKKPIKYMHPSLTNALKNTYGFPLYDESLLILAKDVAGWDLAEADKLRKLTKEKGKNPEKAEKWRQEFIEGAKNNNVKTEDAIRIWDEIVGPFGRYSFNLSHAIEYSMVSYHTAYLKANFPVEFLLANLMSEIRSNTKDATKNIEKIKSELKSSGIKILPPDINKSDMEYKLGEDNSLLTGLEALKFMGGDAIKDILEKRPFSSFEDFMARTDGSKVRATSIQALASSGCFDQWNINRKQAYLYCQDYRKKLQVWKKKNDPKDYKYPFPDEQDWTIQQKYALELEYLGEAFICQVKEGYAPFFTSNNKSSLSIREIRNMANKDKIPSMVVVIRDIFEFKVKKETSKYLGNSMIKATVEDEFGDQITLTVFPQNLKDIRDSFKGTKQKFEEGIAIHFSGTVNEYNDEIGIVLENLYSISLPPQKPKDLKAKKVAKQTVEIEKKLEEIDIDKNIDEYFSTLEDMLIESGEIDDENFEND